jgi:hypothetical protein
MRISPILFLIYISAGFLNCSCNAHSHLQKIRSGESCVLKFKPDFKHVLYQTSVDITGKHFSGILLIKKMQDSSIRFSFSNESGFSFFDFGFGPDSGFFVFQITPRMNKKAVIKTLRKDFELLLFSNMDTAKSYTMTDSSQVYHAYPQPKGINYYITDTNCSRLIKMQRASKHKPVMEAYLGSFSVDKTPDSISIHHLNFNFSISLTKILPLVNQ